MLSRLLFRPSVLAARSTLSCSLSHSSRCCPCHSSLRCFSSAAAPSSTPAAADKFKESPHGIGLNLESVEENFIGQPLHRLPGPFGTMQKPAVVFSEFHSRIVGCQGGAGAPHAIRFFELKKGPKHVCIDCGQVFLLQSTPAANPAANSNVAQVGGAAH